VSAEIYRVIVSYMKIGSVKATLDSGA